MVIFSTVLIIKLPKNSNQTLRIAHQFDCSYYCNYTVTTAAAAAAAAAATATATTTGYDAI